MNCATSGSWVLLRMPIRMIMPLLITVICVPAFSQNTYPWPSTGNIGIGTTSPDQALTVNGSTHVGKDLNLTRTDNWPNGSSIVLDNVISKNLFIQKVGGGNINSIDLNGTAIGLNGVTTIGGSSNPGNSKLTIWTNVSGDGLYIGHDGSSYGGNSGIVRLHGPSLVQGGWNGITQSGDAGIIFGTSNGATNNGFVLTPWSSGTTGLRIDKSGNVGIWTANTQNYQLAVNGSAIFTKVVVKAYPNWPDYVFKDDYRLPSLDSISRYILINKHLPEIPAADSVEKNGLDVGANQSILLKKIEELTLYVIEQHRNAIEQQKQLDGLKAENKRMHAELRGLKTNAKK